MAEIRPLERQDLSAAARLLRANLPIASADKQFERALGREFLDAPWRDSELPSLVAVENGEVVGFIGCQVRRFRFKDRQLRGVCPSHLTVSPASRGGATGALLLRRLLTAGQDFTYADTANEEVTRMWRTFGADLDAARVCNWMVVLRPTRWLASLAGAIASRRGTGGGSLPVGALPLKALLPGARRRNTADDDISGEDADPGTIATGMDEMARGLLLWPDYDAAHLEHVFADVEGQFGPVVARIVRRGGRPLGWYAYVMRRGAIRMLHLLAPQQDGAAVIDELLAHARQTGATVVSGRLEPHLAVPMQAQMPVLGFARRPWIHTRDPEIRSVLAGNASLLTQLDGEWFVD